MLLEFVLELSTLVPADYPLILRAGVDVPLSSPNNLCDTFQVVSESAEADSTIGVPNPHRGVLARRGEQATAFVQM